MMCLHVLPVCCDSTESLTPTWQSLDLRSAYYSLLVHALSSSQLTYLGVINKGCTEAECLYSTQTKCPIGGTNSTTL